MRNLYQSFERGERILVWTGVLALAILMGSLAGGDTGAVAAAQIAAALGTLTLAGLAYAQVGEMREVRVAQERPQVIVDADYGGRDTVSVVVKNIGPGAAKDITFDFSAPLYSTLDDPKGGPGNFVVSDLPYLKDGLDYLAPGSEIRSGWDTYANLFGLLREKGLEDGIRATSRYRDLSGRDYATEWTVNPLKVEGALQFAGLRKKGVHELAKAAERIDRKLPPR